MRQFGMIFAALAFVAAVLVTLLVPYCVPCVVVFIGAGAGYLTGSRERPGDAALAARRGALAGAIAGAGALLGHLVGGGINAVWVGPEGAAETMRNFGLGLRPLTPELYYTSTFVINGCLGLFEIPLMAGAGALGGLLSRQMTRPAA